MASGRYYALSVFANIMPDTDEKITVHPGVDVCCKSTKGAKGILLRNSSICAARKAATVPDQIFDYFGQNWLGDLGIANSLALGKQSERAITIP